MKALSKKEICIGFALAAHFLVSTNPQPFIRLFSRLFKPKRNPINSQSTRLSVASLSDDSIETKTRFEAACNLSKECLSASNAEKLQLYGLFKQATEGDNNKTRPGSYIDGLKWDSWSALKGKNAQSAMEDYVRCVMEIYERMNIPVEEIDFSSEEEGRPKENQPMLNLARDQGETGGVRVSRIAEELSLDDGDKLMGSVDPETLYFYLLLREKKYEELKSLMKTKEININTQFDEKGMLPIHVCIEEEDLDGLEFVLLSHADINAKDKSGNTPLHSAILMDNTAVLQKILSFHPDPSIQDDSGSEPIQMARGESAQILREYTEAYQKQKP